MGSRVLHCSMLFLFTLFLISDSSAAEKPTLDAMQQKQKLVYQKNQIIFSSLKSTTQLVDVTPVTLPVVIPNTPTMPTPTANPTNPVPPTTAEPTPTPTTTTPTPAGGTWCIASPTASQTALQVAIDYACGYGGADCSAIQSGASCYDPNTLRDHASYAFNVYYLKNPIPTSCVFGGTAQLTHADPSSGNCHYALPNTTPSASTSINPTTTSSSNNPATPSSSIYPTTPSEATDYSTEPNASPSSVDSKSLNLLLLFIMTCLSHVAINYH